MSFIIEQKIGSSIYLYEVQSYWDPKKKAVQAAEKIPWEEGSCGWEACAEENRLSGLAPGQSHGENNKFK